MVNTPSKFFNKVCKQILIGEGRTPTQVSKLVHSATNKTRHPIDMNFWKKIESESYILDRIEEYSKSEDIYVYRVFNKRNDREEVLHGYIFTTADHRLLRKICVNPHYICQGILNEVTRFVAIQK